MLVSKRKTLGYSWTKTFVNSIGGKRIRRSTTSSGSWQTISSIATRTSLMQSTRSRTLATGWTLSQFKSSLLFRKEPKTPYLKGREVDRCQKYKRVFKSKTLIIIQRILWRKNIRRSHQYSRSRKSRKSFLGLQFKRR